MFFPSVNNICLAPVHCSHTDPEQQEGQQPAGNSGTVEREAA